MCEGGASVELVLVWRWWLCGGGSHVEVFYDAEGCLTLTMFP